MRMRFLAVLLSGVFASGVANAFPDTIRHGYVNCTTCHVSPSGGGLMNGYGRSLSNELLSTWGRKNEEQPLHGLITIPEKLQETLFVGGDTRYISRREKTDRSTVDEGFWMQAQLRAGIAFDKFKLIGAVGKIENPRAEKPIRWIAPEFYGIWNFQENMHLRAGRFEPIYGLRLPDHNLWVRSEPGFVPWAERDTLELITEGERQTLSLAGFQSLSNQPQNFQATGYTGTFYQVLGERSRVGVSGINREGQGLRDRSLSWHGTISLSEKLYIHSELSRNWHLAKRVDAGFTRVGYEIFKGLTPFLQAQFRAPNGASDDAQKYGLGAIWLPRPHFEIMAYAENHRALNNVRTENFILFHYYL